MHHAQLHLDDGALSRLLAFDESVASHVETECETPAETDRQLANAMQTVARLRSLARRRPLRTLRQFRQAKPARSKPARIGRFELLRSLGQGGFGVVHLAFDPVVQRHVALKVPRAEVMDKPSVRRRILTEFRAVGRLDHPNIVKLHEAGEADGVVFSALEWVDGPSLAAWLRSRSAIVRPTLAAEWLSQLAKATAHAHRMGVLHRDIKPSNILLKFATNSAVHSSGKFDSTQPPTPLLTDFGLARIGDALGDETRSGTILGTAQYMSPEQAEGKVRAIGPSADIYSLGAVLYELLCGRPPLLGESEIDTLRKVASKQPVAPRKLTPGIPRDLEVICLKCLEKEPAARYANADDLADDLDRLLDGEPILARRPGPIRRLWSWSKRRPALAALCGLAVVTPMILLAGYAAFDRQRRTLGEESSLRTYLECDATQVAVAAKALPVSADFKRRLREVLVAEDSRPRQKRRAAAALGASDAQALAFLASQLGLTESEELPFLIQSLYDAAEPVASLVRAFENKSASQAERARVGVALATMRPVALDGHWPTFVDALIDQSTNEVAHWSPMLEAVCSKLTGPLEARFYGANTSAAHRLSAARWLASLHAGNPQKLTELIGGAAIAEYGTFLARLENLGLSAIAALQASHATAAKSSFEARAHWAAALWKLGEPRFALAGLADRADPDYRFRLPHGLRAARLDPNQLVAQFVCAETADLRFGLALAIAECSDVATLSPDCIETLRDSFRCDPNSGVHSACGWVLKRLRPGEPLPDVTKVASSIREKRRWQVTNEGHTMIRLEVDGPTKMGSPSAEALHRGADEGPAGNESIVEVQLKPFAISAHEVTVDQFRRFDPKYVEFKPAADSSGCPCNDVSHFAAASYCNWLSTREGMAKGDLCYRMDDKRKIAMFVPDRKGYRLPTEAEWEFACRAGSSMRLFFGSDVATLSEYAWHAENSSGLLHPIGEKRPNPFGLFDVYGNVREWCEASRPCQDTLAILRDFGFDQAKRIHGSARRSILPKKIYYHNAGFRIARSIGNAIAP